MWETDAPVTQGASASCTWYHGPLSDGNVRTDGVLIWTPNGLYVSVKRGIRLGKSRVFLFGRAPYNFVKLSVNSYIVDRTHKYRITTWIQNSGDTEHARPTYHAAFKVEYQTLSWSNSQPTCLCVTILFIVWFRSQLGLRLFWADPRWRNPPSVRVRCTRRTDRSDRSRSRSSTVDQIDHDLYNLL